MNILSKQECVTEIQKIANRKYGWKNSKLKNQLPVNKVTINQAEKVLDILPVVHKIACDTCYAIDFTYYNECNSFKISVKKDHILISGYLKRLEYNADKFYPHFVKKFKYDEDGNVNSSDAEFINAAMWYYLGFINRKNIFDLALKYGIVLNNEYLEAVDKMISNGSLVSKVNKQKVTYVV